MFMARGGPRLRFDSKSRLSLASGSRLLALGLFALLFAACSTIKLGYNNADTLLLYSLDRYVSLTDDQEQMVRRRVAVLDGLAPRDAADGLRGLRPERPRSSRRRRRHASGSPRVQRRPERAHGRARRARRPGRRRPCADPDAGADRPGRTQARRRQHQGAQGVRAGDQAGTRRAREEVRRARGVLARQGQRAAGAARARLARQPTRRFAVLDRGARAADEGSRRDAAPDPGGAPVGSRRGALVPRLFPRTGPAVERRPARAGRGFPARQRAARSRNSSTARPSSNARTSIASSRASRRSSSSSRSEARPADAAT